MATTEILRWATGGYADAYTPSTAGPHGCDPCLVLAVQATATSRRDGVDERLRRPVLRPLRTAAGQAARPCRRPAHPGRGRAAAPVRQSPRPAGQRLRGQGAAAPG